MSEHVEADAEVQAAGGVIVRTRSDRVVEVALVHRPRYDDWTLPKGKLDPGETSQRAARREVREETGLQCELGEELSSTSYTDHQGRNKVVRYWTMSPRGGRFVPNEEVDELRWLSVADALELLTYERDQPLVREAAAQVAPGG